MILINNKTIAVIVPCFNEETQIEMVIDSMPVFVDRIIVVNDGSTDNTENKLKNLIKKDKHNFVKIDNILNKIKPNKHNRANVVLQEVQKKEIKYFVEHSIYFNESSRIVLINHKNNTQHLS